MISTITVKIKNNFFLEEWFQKQSLLAAELYNNCLKKQFERASWGEPLYTAFDLANQFRLHSLASDYKDRIFERVAKACKNWYTSENLRYSIYWQHQEKSQNEKEKLNTLIPENYLFLREIEKKRKRNLDYRTHVKRLSRKQKVIGKPRLRKTCSLAFSIRSTRQDTVSIQRRKIKCTLPKFKKGIAGHYNFLPTSSSYMFKLGTLKKDACGTFWLMLTVEDHIKPLIPERKSEKISVGIDMGLKTARSAVSVDINTKQLCEVYQPERVRFFEKGYKALVFASQKYNRALPYIHRKIRRRRRDCIDKEVKHILNMGDEFKFGKPSSAFLFSGRLARSAADVANSLFLVRFAKRAEVAGKEWDEVDESYTSVTCRICQRRKPMPLSERVYCCAHCGHEEDRDKNSAYQIALRDYWEKGTSPSKKQTGELSRRGMKASRQDFQATPPCKPHSFMGVVGLS